MKIVILILCFFISLINFANAGEMYNCTDHNGNKIITDNPQDGMKCDIKKIASASSIVGVWISAERTKEGRGGIKTYKTDNIIEVEFGALSYFEYKISENKLTLSSRGIEDKVQKVEFKDAKMILVSASTGERREFSCVQHGTIKKCTEEDTAVRRQILHFTTHDCYINDLWALTNGTYQIVGDNLTESFHGKNIEWKWAIHENVLTLTDKKQGITEKWLRIK